MKFVTSRERPVLFCIDDDAQLLETLEFLLTRNFPSHRVVACINGQDAIDQLQECKVAGREIQLILSDQVMDDLTGIEVLSRVPDLYPDAIRIILTGQAGLQSAINAIKIGIDDYMEKPISELDLVKTIRNHLSNYLLRQDNRRLQEFIKQSHLRTSEITDLAFRSFNYHLTRLLSNDGDRREIVESIRKARENISLLSHLYKLNQGMIKGSSFADITPEQLVQESISYVKGKGDKGILREKKQDIKVQSFEQGTSIHGNLSVMRIVLERILENACKYSPESSTILLTIRGQNFINSPDRSSQLIQPDLIDLLRRNFIIISITDAGTPTPEDFQNLLYVQEWQHPSSDAMPALKGLGLVIAQEYLLIMGGHLFIDSKVGIKSTSVHVALPCDARGLSVRS